MTKLTYEEVTVTPSQAKQWLKTNTDRQRSIKSRTVKDYAKTMVSGNWLLNGEALIFDDKGRLANGQHRLSACVLANVPFETTIVRGVSDKAFDTIDTGANRSAGDVFKIMGALNSNVLAAAVRMTIRYQQTPLNKNLYQTGRYKINNHEALELYKSDKEQWDKDIRELISPAYKKAYDLLSPACGGFLYHLFKNIDHENCIKFFYTMATGIPTLTFENKQLNCPVHAAREKINELRLDAGKMAHGAWYNHLKIGICLFAWNCLLEGKGIVRMPNYQDKLWPEIANDPYRGKNDLLSKAKEEEDQVEMAV
jgi:hypothetical protein